MPCAPLPPAPLPSAPPPPAPLPPRDLHLPNHSRQGVWPSPPPPFPPVLHTALDSYLTVNTTPAHPDFDVSPPGCFHIQIGLSNVALPVTIQHPDVAFVYGPAGACIGTIRADRMLWLYSCYCSVLRSDPSVHHTHSTCDFPRDVADLLHRYTPPRTPSPPLAPNAGWELPDSIMPLLSPLFPFATHRFASPLTVPLYCPSYFSDFAPDALFGATSHASHSHGLPNAPRHPSPSHWTGISLAFPPYTTVAIEAAVRWAIASAAHDTVPSCTVLLLPVWPGKSFTTWLSSPTARVTHTLPASSLALSHPPSPSGFTDPLCPPLHPKWALQVVCIFNTLGLTALPPDTRALLLACSPHSPQGIRDFSPLSRWGPPRHFPSSPLASPVVFRPLPSSPCSTLPSLFPPTYPLYWPRSLVTYYTDGAAAPSADGGTRLGAAFVHTPTQATFLIAPCGCRETQTITRAEAAAIYYALFHAATHHPTEALVIFSDSLVCLFDIERIMRLPRSLLENKHCSLFRAIHDLLRSRLQLRLPTCFQKVRAHIGVHGNEVADAGAAAAMADPTACHFSLSDIESQYFATLPAWPCAAVPPRPPPPGQADPSPWFFSDLTTSIKSHIEEVHPAICSATPRECKTFSAVQRLHAVSLPVPGNHMWHTASCTFPMIKNVLLIRYRLLWCAARAALCDRPYVTSGGVRTDGLCPLCPVPCPPPDTAGHILGSCALPPFPAMKIARHNTALVHLHACIYQGSLGGCYTIMDATRRACLPVGVSGTRLPQWMLPDYDDALLLLFRPDILLIAGLPTAAAPTSVLLLPALRAIQARCVVHLVELTYTHDSCYDATLLRKRVQHATLVLTLRTAGWTVHAPVHVVLLGTYGTIFSLITPVLRHLGVTGHLVAPLLRTLHVHAVTAAWSMVSLRRRLEHTSVFRSNPAAPLHLHAYPP